MYILKEWIGQDRNPSYVILTCPYLRPKYLGERTTIHCQIKSLWHAWFSNLRPLEPNSDLLDRIHNTVEHKIAIKWKNIYNARVSMLFFISFFLEGWLAFFLNLSVSIGYVDLCGELVDGIRNRTHRVQGKWYW